MTDESQSAATKLQFSERHRPVLDAGDYTITIEPIVKHGPIALLDARVHTEFKVEQRFSVSGPRFSLNPQEIEAVFPPAGSLGEHSNVLPHVVLKRSTLPWERSANGDAATPWLALLLFDEHDGDPVVLERIRVPKSLQVAELTKQGSADFPPFGKEADARLKWEAGDHGNDAVSVIDVPREMVAAIAPSAEELKLLAHVRQNSGTGAGDERAVLICNRLPCKGSTSIVHLVSVEARYNDRTLEYGAKADLIRLVSLYSWRFSCVSETHSFTELLKTLRSGTLRLPDLKTQCRATDAASPYLARGCVPLPHRMRQGNTSVSWYHGPLVAGGRETSVPLPVRTADELVLYNDTIGMFDVSYSAAWQLGRLLTLQNRRIAVDLFNWKRSHAQSIKDVRGQLDYMGFDAPSAPDFPDSVRTWLVDLALLKGVPFNYLVPDAAMLPPESIRFFQIDVPWIECLRDGAFSIGRVFAADFEHDRGLHTEHVAPRPQPMSGFLMRSDVVAGWPGLLVDGYSAEKPPREPLPVARPPNRLSKNVLLCLFHGALAAVDFHLAPEALHSELSGSDGTWTKRKRINSDGRWSEVKEAVPVEVPIKTSTINSHTLTRIDINALADSLGARNSAEFALQMIEGTPKVRFSIVSEA